MGEEGEGGGGELRVAVILTKEDFARGTQLAYQVNRRSS